MAQGVGAYDLKDPEQVKDYLKELETTWSYACFSEKSAEACHRLAAFYKSIQQDVPKASKVFKRNCDDYGYGHSCYEYAQHAMVGKGGVPKDRKLSLEYHTRGCEGDPPFAGACHNAALLRSTNEEFKDYTKAVEMFEKACYMQDSMSCFRLSTIYFTGNEVIPKDMKKCVELSKKGCELRDWRSCGNVAYAYKKGKGVDQNETLAKKFAKRAVILKKETPK